MSFKNSYIPIFSSHSLLRIPKLDRYLTSPFSFNTYLLIIPSKIDAYTSLTLPRAPLMTQYIPTRYICTYPSSPTARTCTRSLGLDGRTSIAPYLIMSPLGIVRISVRRDLTT